MALFGAQPNDPAHVAAFKVTVDGLQIPHVTEVSGLTQEVDKVEVKQQMADGKFVISQTMGRPKPVTAEIKCALTDSTTAKDWIKTVMDGDIAGSRKTMIVEYLDYKGAVIRSFELQDAWVTKVAWSGSKAGDTAPTIETVSVTAPTVIVT
jgi:phage tail-like protein